MKKLVSMFLALAMCLSLAVPAFAEVLPSSDSAKTYTAQVYHAVGVDKYSSNIQDVAKVCMNIPVRISQSKDGIHIELQLEEEPITIDASVRGKNLNGNMVYFDISSIDVDSLSVLTLAYIEDFSHGAVLAQDYCEQNPNVKNVLELYLKVHNSEVREYYFLEIFDFALENFSEIADQECKADFWVAKEFSPVSSEVTESTDEITPYILTGGLSHTFTNTYKFGSIYDMVASLTVTTSDEYSNIPKEYSTPWNHRLEITKQSTKCEDAPEYDANDSVIIVAGLSFAVTAPKNCAIRSTMFEGEAQRLHAWGGAFSATVNVALGPISVSADIGQIAKNLGTVKVNEAFTTYNNADPNNRNRAVRLDFSHNYYLSNTGDYLDVQVEVGDYGNVTTAENYMNCRWVMTAENHDTGECINSGYVLSSSYPVKVN